MIARPWKLRAFKTGYHGYHADTRSFASREAAERVAAALKHEGWQVRVWRRSTVAR